ncbi:glutamyl-tRNA amidotransferase [bacterium]|nr:glutamyl-tRNA amidotransferase [bacterium]|tara:strand:- start:8648 stop:9103 length:456 start_codon:yes stop_codon:yes gene_type:complete
MASHEAIKASLPETMKSKDAVKLRTVRSILTALTNESVATGGTPQDLLDDAATDNVIKRLAKQRKDSIEQYEAANRPELAEPEKEELAVLESYLPQMMSQDEIRPIAEAKMAELGIEDKSKMGILIGAVMKETAGQADGSVVKMVVEEVLE